MERREHLTRLRGELAAEAECYRALLLACQEHRGVLLAGKAAAMEDSLRHQLRLLTACNEASRARSAASRALAGELGLGEPCSTGRLLASLPPAEAAALREPYTQMQELSGKLADQNAQNRQLAEHRLDLMQGDFASLQRLVCEATGRPLAEGETGEGSLISTRA
jgi:hypothetical protein